MSGEPNQDEPKPAADEGPAAEIPVEVEAPDKAAEVKDPVAELEAKVATLEKESKDNKDRWLRAAADLENTRKRTKREIEAAMFELKN